MRRAAFGVLLILHGLAHTGPGLGAAAARRSWLLASLGVAPEGVRWTATAAWGVAMIGFVAAGVGLLGVPALRPGWRRTAVVAVLSSVALLLLFSPSYLSVIGVLIDVVILVAVLGRRPEAAGQARADMAGPAPPADGDR